MDERLEGNPTIHRRLDRYELIAELASGGMATVYLGRLAGAGGFERLVAIKRLHPHLEREQEFVTMFLDEARIAARINHLNVVPTLEVGVSEGRYFLVMPYVEGDTLGRLLKQSVASSKLIPHEVVLRIMLDALTGLHAAHELCTDDGKPLGLVHRDVSPQNILVGVDGMARIMDFGVARAASRLAITRSGQLKGKIGYMAPEQIRSESVIDRRADVFAAGVVLWESLTAKRLFRGRNDSDAETLYRIMYEEIPRARSRNPLIPEEIDEVCARALERDPNVRFASSIEFAEALEAAAESAGVRMATAREVARYVGEVCGPTLHALRESIRALTASRAVEESPVIDFATPTQMPKLLNSAPPPSLSLWDRSVAPTTTGEGGIAIAPSSSHRSLLWGMVAGALLAMLAGAGALWFGHHDVGQRSTGDAASSGVPVLASELPSAGAASRVPAAEPTAVTSFSTSTPLVGAAATLATASSASGSVKRAVGGAVSSSGVGVGAPSGKTKKPSAGEDLLSNPYRLHKRSTLVARKSTECLL